MPWAAPITSCLHHSSTQRIHGPTLENWRRLHQRQRFHFLALLALGAVLCFHFPEYFTTPEFREVYTGEVMKTLLLSVVIASFFFAALSFLLSQRKKRAVIGIVISALAVAAGGLEVQARSVEKTVWHIGPDWLLLDLLLLAVIFVPIEMAFPKNQNQSRFHTEWRTDLVYFVISHLFVQFFGAITQAPAKLLLAGWDWRRCNTGCRTCPLCLNSSWRCSLPICFSTRRTACFTRTCTCGGFIRCTTPPRSWTG